MADRFHLSLNLTQAVERELAAQRPYPQLAPSKALELQMPRPLDRAKRAGRQASMQSSVWQQEVEMGRLRRQENIELFQTLHRMKAAGLKVTEMARELGLNRRRLDRWLRLDTLPERNRMQPRPGMPEAFREYLRRRGRQVADMVELFLRKSGNSAMWVASPGWQPSSLLGANRRWSLQHK